MRIPALIFILVVMDVYAGSRFDFFEQQKAQKIIRKRIIDTPTSPCTLPTLSGRDRLFKGGIHPLRGGTNINKENSLLSGVTLRLSKGHHSSLFPSWEGLRGGSPTHTKPDSANYRKRQHLCYAIGFGGTAIVHAGLYQLWYKDYPSTKFHFFNDNGEWLQMDKFGHAFSSYYLGLCGIEAARWAGVPENKQWKWGLFGSIFQDPIEIWDGFSSGWGASAGDLIANTFGSVLSAGQHALWKEQKIIMKLSYTPSRYARIRPNVLGSNLQESLLKDYNAQTYWLCYSPLKRKGWEWLGLGLGYGADGMVGGHDNVWVDKNNAVHNDNDITRYRQYYIALDYNLTKIKTNNKTLKTLFFIFNCIKLPSPALEFSQGKFKGHWLKF